ncbi:MAG: tol-pal system protein YbgF [Alphaproteobacteria bacterium]|nr:tol-pal system protein YbgF [Alphaproteobacteria bacterium]MBV9694657.1 tol-pal system protein YbgF [Alphaproteobacteria bacterium]
MRLRLATLAAVMAATAYVLPAQAGLFGETDDEKAARIHEQNQDASLTELRRRVQDLEDSLQRATGQNEALAHQVQQLNDKIERQRRDFEYRLCTIAGQQLGAQPQAEGGDGDALPCPGAQPQAQNFPPPGAATPPVRLTPPPGALGTLPAGRTAPAQGPPPAFNAALDLLAHARYDEARAQFRAFADANPSDDYAPQAVYWIGDIDYAQKDFAAAARAFVDVLKKYPASNRAPESMLKLGQSLIAMGQTKEGCKTLAALNSQYPSASKTIAQQAAAERKTACH